MFEKSNNNINVINVFETRYIMYDTTNKKILESYDGQYLNFSSIESCNNCLKYYSDQFKEMGYDVEKLIAVEVGFAYTGKTFPLI